MGLRMPELIIIGLILVVLFGGSKLPQLGAGIGQGIRNFKKAMSGEDEPKKDATPPEQAPKA
jgi:sec-independent protein translocase protein TatA